MRVFFILFLCPAICLSQLEAGRWYFGFSAGLDFNTDPPTPLFNNATTISNEGVSTMSDQSGNLLFYSNNGTIWNKNHFIMSNGTSIKGARILPVKQPGASSLYYLFCSTSQSDTAFRYSIIDMALASGNGSVIAKNVPIFSPGTKMLAGALHCNGSDVWIVTHSWGNNNYHAYLLTAAGLQTTAVVSSVGSSVSGPNYGIATSILKISPTGKKMAAALCDPVSDFEVFDFNNNTGIISGLQSFTLQYSSVSDCEFSPDGSKLYCEFPESAARLYQWDLCTGQKTHLEDGFVSGMQLAINGKIYAVRGYDTTLDVIESPNRSGSSCNFTRKGQSIFPKTGNGSLPMHISAVYKFGPVITHTFQNECRDVQFNTALFDSLTNSCAQTTPTVGTISWDFGDNSTSNSIAPLHSYQSPGTYTVKLIVQGPCVADTMRRIITVPVCVGLSELSNKELQIQIVPNPNSGEFALIIPSHDSADFLYTIYNSLGQFVQSGDFREQQKIVLDDSSPGLYFIEIKCDGKQLARQKVVIAQIN